jgi:hypothetical protein|tara:strand:- start:9 stop:302 length:294 start_codon:yes stop_codon:yes gene_type:complete
MTKQFSSEDMKTIEANFKEIEKSFKETKDAFDVVNETIIKITSNQKIIVDRIEEIEKTLSKIPTPDKIMYRPVGEEGYMNIGDNFDMLYAKIKELQQ